MVQHTQTATTNELTFQETIRRLVAAPPVDGLALFGSRNRGGPSASNNPVSDYDLLVLVNELPAPIFQMWTHVEGRMADMVFYTTEMVDRLDAERAPVGATAFEGYFLQKMFTAQILYDASGRLARAQRYVQNHADPATLYAPTSPSARYSDWFWLNHSLAHIRRMAQSDDSIYLAAVDLMLMGSLAGICRVYYRLRDLPWEGEKAALRTLQTADAAYFNLLMETINAVDRRTKISRFAALAAATLEPEGALWQPRKTAVYLRNQADQPERVAEAIAFWESLLSE